ncbi:MAG TPA: serine/threonine-protein kinase, partial [Candidatus Angelobacter sp.]|nr:serine/threonine-protein kinase [Candidatus Angelobacter sp.]
EMQTPDLSGTRYRALKLLGHGGMGTIWLAEDSVLHRTVALKVLSAESSSADLASRLMQEAVILARLEHPGIVPVHDAGTLPDGRTFYCMKYVEGQTLDQHIARLDVRQRLQLLQRIAEPLAFAHSRGIIHRDLKPGNVMVGAFGEVLIMDWGLAKVMSAAEKSLIADTDATSTEAAPTRHSSSTVASAPQFSSATTAHGTVLGTPGYMAPEQERGEINLIDQRTDVFGLGSILQFMLRDKTSASNEAVPRPLQAICQKALAKEMSGRYASAQDFAADIGKYLDGLPVSAYKENIFERTARLVNRNQVAVALVLMYLLMRVLFILFSRR